MENKSKNVSCRVRRERKKKSSECRVEKRLETINFVKESDRESKKSEGDLLASASLRVCNEFCWVGVCERKGKSYRVEENHSITIKFCVFLRVSVFNVLTVYILSTFWNAK